ncbi:MAG: hypothetical protein QOJ68_996 [Blastococcus sp.]|jgi:hypothetical protein|nr:hypothetical protein [Blastococcus sp.]
MTASTRDPRSADDDAAAAHLRVRWLSGPSLRLHAALTSGIALAGGATWLEWTRAHDGHAVAWVYTFEWPLFAVLGTVLWWRLLHAETQPARQPGRTPETGAPEAGAEAADPDLLAWQAYLARLHEADPPGGPPQR